MKRSIGVRLAVCLSLLFLLPVGMAIPVCAAEEAPVAVEETMPKEWLLWLDALPEEIRTLLPDELFESDPTDVTAAVSSMTEAGTVLRFLRTRLVGGIGDCLRLLPTLLGLILLSAVFSALRHSMNENAPASVLQLLSRLSILSAILYLAYDTASAMEGFFEKLGTCMRALVPLMATLWALGGDIGAASAGSSLLLTFIGLCEWLCRKTVLPMLTVSLFLALTGALEPGIDLHGCAAFVRRFCATLTGFVTMLFSTVMGLQTTIAARADSLAMKSARFAVGSFLPVTGGTVAGLLQTIGGSVGLLRTTVGTAAVVVLLMLLFPPVLSMLLTRLCFMAAASVAELLGCDGEAKICREMVGLYGYLAGMAALCAGMFLLALAVFIRGIPACGA